MQLFAMPRLALHVDGRGKAWKEVLGKVRRIVDREHMPYSADGFCVRYC